MIDAIILNPGFVSKSTYTACLFDRRKKEFVLMESNDTELGVPLNTDLLIYGKVDYRELFEKGLRESGNIWRILDFIPVRTESRQPMSYHRLAEEYKNKHYSVAIVHANLDIDDFVSFMYGNMTWIKRRYGYEIFL